MSWILLIFGLLLGHFLSDDRKIMFIFSMLFKALFSVVGHAFYEIFGLYAIALYFLIVFSALIIMFSLGTWYAVLSGIMLYAFIRVVINEYQKVREEHDFFE